MKLLSLPLLFAGLAAASPLAALVDNAQVPLGRSSAYPGFDIDLSENRLVKMEGKDPVWMTELEKARSFLVFQPMF
jgi:hypothetical protein